MRRVVRPVVPSGTEEKTQPSVSTSASESGPSKAGAAADKDDISLGLTSLMGRGRTKEHRPRTRTQDRKEEAKEEAKQEEKGKVEEEKQEEASSVTTPATANPMPLKSNPVIPPPKPDPLAPPAGFIPIPKQNPLTPPPGFIPAKKSSPVLPKQNPLVRSPGFIPIPKTDPLAPPAGFIPKPRLLTVKKPELVSKKSACLPLDICVEDKCVYTVSSNINLSELSPIQSSLVQRE